MNVQFKKTDSSDSVDGEVQTELAETTREQVVDHYVKFFARLKLLAISFLSVIVLVYLFYNLIMNKDQTVGEKMEIVTKLLSASAHIGALGHLPNNTLHWWLARRRIPS